MGAGVSINNKATGVWTVDTVPAQRWTWDELPTEAPYTPDIRKMWYKNPRSKNAELRNGRVVEVDFAQKRMFNLEDADGTVRNVEHLRRMDTTLEVWMSRECMRPVEETNEFGIVSP